MRVYLEGKVLNVHRQEFTGKKDGQIWEVAIYQVLTEMPGLPLELEDLQVMDRKGSLHLDPLMVAAQKSGARVRVCANVSVDRREGRPAELQVRIVKVEPAFAELDKREKLETVGAGK